MTATLKLYELGEVLTAVAEELLANGGELTPEIEAQLSALEGAFEQKVERILLYARNLRATALAAKAEVERLSALAGSRDHAADRLVAYVKGEMERANRDKIETDRIVVRIQRNSRPSISWLLPIEDLPEAFARIRREVDGARAYDAWKAGEPLPEGFEVVQGTHLRVR